MCSEYITKEGKCVPVGGKADLVDGTTLKPQCWYIVEGGKWVEVDLTDGVFTYVVRTIGNVKKLRDEHGKTLYLVSDGQGNAAHGDTITEAREDLKYKIVAKFDGTLPESATGLEWIGIYRAVTGACAKGVRMFVESIGANVDATYTIEDINDLVHGQYGAEQFNAAIDAAKGNPK